MSSFHVFDIEIAYEEANSETAAELWRCKKPTYAARSLIFPGRVVWTDDQFLGLAFSGSSRKVQGRYAEHPRHGYREAAGGKQHLRAPTSVS